MSTDPDRPYVHVVPRPGVLKGLGIANIVFAIMNVICVFSTSFWYVMALSGKPEVPGGQGPGPGPDQAGSRTRCADERRVQPVDGHG